MNRTKTRPKSKQTDISRSFMALNIMSGREKAPDYIGYNRATRRLEDMPLMPDEYERKKKSLAERYGV